MRWLRVTWLLLTALALTACGQGELSPKPIDPAADICPACLMTVVDSGYAAEYLGHDGDILVFDDPGCLVLYQHDHPEVMKNGARYVQDVLTKQWLKWETAQFVDALNASSPMNYGLHAFANSGEAGEFMKNYPGSRAISTLELASTMSTRR